MQFRENPQLGPPRPLSCKRVCTGTLHEPKTGLALKNPHKKKPLKMFFFVGFFGFFLFLIFYENNTNFSLSTRFFMNNQKGGGDTLACG
jgi:hypothetical protein